MPEPRIICPVCLNSFPLAAASAGPEWLELAELAARFGKDAWCLAWEYSNAFRSKRTGVATVARRLRVLAELLTVWESGEFRFDGRRFRTDKRRLLAALEIVCVRQLIGLVNSNYLKQVLTDSGDLLSATGETAVEEEAREIARRARRPDDDSIGAAPCGRPDCGPAQGPAPTEDETTEKEVSIDLENFLAKTGIKRLSDAIRKG